VRERDVESYLVDRVKERGGEVRKMQWIGRRAANDRFVALHGAHLVELKRPGKEAEDHQAREHKRLSENGCSVWCLDSYEAVDKFIGAVDPQIDLPGEFDLVSLPKDWPASVMREVQITEYKNRNYIIVHPDYPPHIKQGSGSWERITPHQQSHFAMYGVL
jgi:hypothetical protein